MSTNDDLNEWVWSLDFALRQKVNAAIACLKKKGANVSITRTVVTRREVEDGKTATFYDNVYEAPKLTFQRNSLGNKAWGYVDLLKGLGFEVEQFGPQVAPVVSKRVDAVLVNKRLETENGKALKLQHKTSMALKRPWKFSVAR